MVLIRAEFEKQPSEHWAKLLTDAGVMNSTVQDHGDFMKHKHTKAVGAVAYVEHDGAGLFPMPHIPGLPRIDGPSAMTHSPHVGEHSVDILKEWGYDDDAINAMQSKKVTFVPA
jgi:crotonobetainyl-CoA:carnitine CoA-transferase CaiB-like acyl-CoA transferase